MSARIGYVTPEVIEIGHVELLTRGGGPSPYADACHCQKAVETGERESDNTA